MDLPVLRLFQREVERQCEFALLAHADLKRALEAHDGGRIWYSVQAFLVATGNISKLLWPPQPREPSKLPERAQELRDSLSVSASSPLEPRAFRNHFEHFDERLESWATTSARRNFIDSNVGRGPAVAGFDVSDYLRNFDTKDHSVTFCGDTYALGPLLEAIEVLHAAAAREASKPSQ